MRGFPVRLAVRPKALVAAIFESILHRQPSRAELVKFSGLIRAGMPLGSLLRGALGLMVDALPANDIQLDLSEIQRQALWDHVSAVWSRLGSEDPYRSVLWAEEFRASRMSDPAEIDRFFESGRANIERVQRYLSRNGYRLPADGICVDYGCGLGRATLWLAHQCRQVIGIDVSQPHLDLAKAHLAARGVGNVTLRRLCGQGDLEILRGMDLFHSIIVLQHNPPPLIADILTAAFAGLNPGGYAFSRSRRMAQTTIGVTIGIWPRPCRRLRWSAMSCRRRLSSALPPQRAVCRWR